MAAHVYLKTKDIKTIIEYEVKYEMFSSKKKDDF